MAALEQHREFYFRKVGNMEKCFGCGKKAELSRFGYLVKHTKVDGSELIVFLSGDLQDEEDRTLHVCQECIEKIFISVVAPMDGGKGFFPASEGGTFGRA